jgi:DNA modification methylase
MTKTKPRKIPSRFPKPIAIFAPKLIDMNSLILGDNLEVLKCLNSESVDLIYLDPPFFSNRNYEVIWGDAGEIRRFQDRWLQLKTGTHPIAVKVVNENGLEAIEIIRLSV